MSLVKLDEKITVRCVEQFVRLQKSFRKTYHQYRRTTISKTSKRRCRNALTRIGVQLRLLGYLLGRQQAISEFLRATTQGDVAKLGLRRDPTEVEIAGSNPTVPARGRIEKETV